MSRVQGDTRSQQQLSFITLFNDIFAVNWWSLHMNVMKSIWFAVWNADISFIQGVEFAVWFGVYCSLRCLHSHWDWRKIPISWKFLSHQPCAWINQHQSEVIRMGSVWENWKWDCNPMAFPIHLGSTTILHTFFLWQKWYPPKYGNVFDY